MIISPKLRTVAFAALLALVSLSLATPAVAQSMAPGNILAWGDNSYGQCTVTALPVGLLYTQVAAGGAHNVALRSDGSVVAWGHNLIGQCNVPALPVGLSYTQVAAGGAHTVALRSDGSAVAWGDNSYGQCTVPALPVGLSYTQVAGTYRHTAALRSDGSAVAWGWNPYGQTNVPALPAGLTYTQVATGGSYTIALRSDGSAVAWGATYFGQTNVPALPAGLSYTQVAAGSDHGVALRSDGSTVAWGLNDNGQTNVPALPAGLSYTQVAAEAYHTVALRSDGSVVAWGYNGYGQTTVPALPAGLTYTQVEAGSSYTVAMRSLPNVFTVAAASASPVGVPINYALSTQNPPASSTIYLLDASFTGSAPGIPVPGSGVIPLNPPFLFIEYGAAFPSIFTGFIGFLDATGAATAVFNTPPLGAFVGLSLSAASVTIDYSTALGIGRISNGMTTQLTMPTPVILSVTPATGGTNGGTTVIINGALFLAGASVSFSGTPATNVTVWNANQITCTTPARPAGVANVSVINLGGVTGTLGGGYTYFYSNPAPSLGAVLPSTGDVVGGTALTISGTGFLAGASVTFAAAAATQVVVVDSTTITCLTPAGALGAADVVVTNMDTQSSTLVGGFTYVYSNPAPAVGAVLPNNGPIAGNAPVTISGTGFLAGASVTFDGAAATQVAVVNSSTITCVTPAGALGAADIVVANPDTQSATLSSGFIYIANLAVTALTPIVAAPGAPLTLTGVGFQTGAQVVAGGVPVTPSSVSTTQIVFPMPAGAACGSQIVVTNPSTQVASIAFNATPTVTAVVYGIGPAAGGALFIIVGTNFHLGSTVTVGGSPATIQSTIMTSIVAVAPPGTVGPAAIVVTSPSGCTATSTYTYL